MALSVVATNLDDILPANVYATIEEWRKTREEILGL